MPQPPRVFISYSHDSDEHRDFVLNLANRLRTEGVESWIDQYVPGFPVQGWQRWMEHEIGQADFVLLVCTPLYHQRFKGEDRQGGRGVNFEGVVISQLLYDNFHQNTKFLPVLPEGGHFEHIPITLRSHFFQLENDYHTLYRVITSQPEVVPPPVRQTVQLPPKNAAPVSPALSLEHAYLESLLQQSQIRFADQTYTTLSGKFQQDRQLIPQECMMAASFLFESYTDKHELRECHSKPEQHEDLLAAFAEHKQLVLLGEPGTGKTFSLWRIAAEQARQTLAQGGGLLPVVIPLNRWTDANQALTDFIQQQTGALKTQFQALCDNGRLLPLLDAMNEIPFDQREIKLPQIRNFVNRDEFKHLLLTCRQRDYSGQLEQDMHRLTIEPLDPPRVYQFLQNYFSYFEKQQPGEFKSGMADDLFWQLAGGEQVQHSWQNWQQHGKNEHWSDFWELQEFPEDWPEEIRWRDSYREQTLSDPRCLLKLAANPYLLFLITSLYAHYSELPKSRIELFGRFVEVLLKREEIDKAKSHQYIPDRQELLQELKQLAWDLQMDSWAEQSTRTVLTYEHAVSIMPAERLEFSASASLLEMTQNTVRFSHHLLQEFLTAQRFTEELQAGLSARMLWPPDQWWEPQGWEEAAKLTVEYETNPVPFLKWLAAGNPKLAAEIVRDKHLNNALLEYRQQWQSAITDIEQYPNPHERHAISTALAWLGWDNRFGIGLNDQRLPEIDWVKIPAGEFVYQDGETQSLPGFYISRYPITNAQFKAFTKDGGFDNEEWWIDIEKPNEKPNHRWREHNRPVETVSWYDAIAFCRWLSARTGMQISLPTEQQWEKAAGGSNTLEYPWGKNYVSGYANINEIWVHEKIGKYNLGETLAVGIYLQSLSPHKVADMSGNVWEWCLNKYHETATIVPDRSDDVRVLRGGGWSALH